MTTQSWQPSASLETLQHRARLRQRIRAFFHERGVLEVETPILASAGTTDPHIDSMTTHSGVEQDKTLYLQTSPEYAMKRLLAVGSSSIYQFGKVFRYGEQGKQHHPEFTLLEWYRPDFDHLQLIDEVDALVRELLSDSLELMPTVKWTYQRAWQETINLNPLDMNVGQLQQFVEQQNIDVTGLTNDKDDWLQLVMSYCVEPALPEKTPVFIYDFPASQAALAKIRHDEVAVAERFELYINGLELANGFHELTDAQEQRQRFESDNIKRQATGKTVIPIDNQLLAALPQMPECAGVALGFDRLMMVVIGAKDILEVVAFKSD